MIRIKYHGRMGNHLFQFAFARILSIELDQYLPNHYVWHYPNTNREFNIDKNNNLNSSTPSLTIRGKNRILIKDVRDQMANSGIGNIILRDSCENYDNFKDYKEQIKNEWFVPEDKFNKKSFDFFKEKLFVKKNGVLIPATVSSVNEDDLIINIRLGDIELENKYRDRLLTIDYFKIILDNVKFNRLFIAAETMSSPTLLPFDKYNPIYFIQDHYMETLNFIKLFNKISISQSTYCWWAAYLSNAKEIYYPVVRNGPWIISPKNSIDLRVKEDRYIYVSERHSKILGKFYEVEKWE